MAEKWDRRDALVKHEQLVQSSWNFTAKMDATRPKFFGTFPYCYQNGTMHLGHTFTLSQLEFKARYLKLKGYNVLLPIGFHGTGMPIVACARKLKESLAKHDAVSVDMESLPINDQIRILYNMGVPREEMFKFVDPYYWLKYFPIRANQDLRRFGIHADYSRSFVTTDLNPFYDSFVRWQFNILNAKGYLKFGKKPIIYSPKDGQVCADHDRSKGEGINPRKYNVYICEVAEVKNQEVIKLAECSSIVLTNDNDIDISNIKSIICHSDDDFMVAIYGGNTFIARPEFFRNLKYQTCLPINERMHVKGSSLHGAVVKVGMCDFKIQDSKVAGINGSGFRILFKNSKQDEIKTGCEPSMLYYEPDGIVVSRTGDNCVVAITDQWFIDYSSPKLKEKVTAYIKNTLVMHEEAKNMLLAASEWIKEWPCSRSYGLGTKLLDTEYVIDSLSDSTIYMAYYTVANRIETIHIQYVNDELWNYVFFDANMPNVPEELIHTIEEMRKEFRYWYPVDIRVSGKDLIPNHLIMCLYNHFMIWNSDHVVPRNYSTNGYVLLNGKKMSKGDGIFMTLREAVDKYGSDATRIAIAEAGSSAGLDDVNFVEKNANTAILKLDTEKEWCVQIIDNLAKEGLKCLDGFWHDVFNTEIMQCNIEAGQYYDKMEYQKVLANGVYKMMNIRDSYRSKYEKNIIPMSNFHMKTYIEFYLLIIYPICPHFVEYLWSYAQSRHIIFSQMWPQSSNMTNMLNYKLILYRDIINDIINSCRSEIGSIVKRNNKKQPSDQTNNNLLFTINLVCYDNYSEIERMLIGMIVEQYNKIYIDNKSWKIISQNIMASAKDKQMLQYYGKFINYVQTQVMVYGKSWFSFVNDATELNQIIKVWLPLIYDDKNISQLIITRSNGNKESQFKFGPTNPSVSLQEKHQPSVSEQSSQFC